MAEARPAKNMKYTLEPTRMKTLVRVTTKMPTEESTYLHGPRDNGVLRDNKGEWEL